MRAGTKPENRACKIRSTFQGNLPNERREPKRISHPPLPAPRVSATARNERRAPAYPMALCGQRDGHAGHARHSNHPVPERSNTHLTNERRTHVNQRGNDGNLSGNRGPRRGKGRRSRGDRNGNGMRDHRGLPGMRDYPGMDDALLEEELVEDSGSDAGSGERMYVKELKAKNMSELTALAEGLNVENAAGMRKQDL